MATEEDQDPTVYRVVVNHEEQYSIWPDFKEIPAGWTERGPKGTKDECLAYIKEVWTDMRPLSLRKRMAEQAGQTGQGPQGA
ncbi:MAG TPA: MbtH family NRPS accessory protein [Vicinamibacterales bacterium]|nr:MbtH family NRPS accessory protein [Vicinamibacterales bacterium]